VIASVRPCPPVPPSNLHGKEGVDGSSPSEGFAKAPQIGAFCLAWICRIVSVRWLLSPLWSPQVHSPRSKRPKLTAFRWNPDGPRRATDRCQPQQIHGALEATSCSERRPGAPTDWKQAFTVPWFVSSRAGDTVRPCRIGRLSDAGFMAGATAPRACMCPCRRGRDSPCYGACSAGVADLHDAHPDGSTNLRSVRMCGRRRRVRRTGESVGASRSERRLLSPWFPVCLHRPDQPYSRRAS
jgi:hypothetical protein